MWSAADMSLSSSVGGRAPSSGLSTQTWTAGTNNNPPSTSQAIGTLQTGTSTIRRIGNQMITIASSQNGTSASTGSSAVSADRST